MIYYEYGSLVLLYDDADKATKAFHKLKETYFEDKQLMVLLLPNLQVSQLTIHFLWRLPHVKYLSDLMNFIRLLIYLNFYLLKRK